MAPGYYDDADPDSTYDSVLLTYDMAPPVPVAPHNMKKIKLSLSVLNPLGTATLADAVGASLTGNAYFTTPSPAVATLTGGAEAVRAKITEISESEAHTTMLRDELKTLTAQLKADIRNEANYVAQVAAGSETKIHSAGFAVLGDPEPRGPLAAVENLVVLTSDMEGQLRLRWKTVEGAVNYSIDMATSADGPWTPHAATTTRIEHIITGLVPGTKYWFRVRAFGSPGYGPYSDPACKMAA